MSSESDESLFPGNPFLILINPPLIINNKSDEHFKRGCTNFKRSQTIMN